MDKRREFGNNAEDDAAKFLEGKGFAIIAKQYKSKYGEIDLVTECGGEVVFVEVKARHGDEFGYPEEAVTPAKIRKVATTGEVYLAKCGTPDRPWRIDVIAIEYHFNPPRITHIENVGLE